MQGHLSDAENLRPCLGSRQNTTKGWGILLNSNSAARTR